MIKMIYTPKLVIYLHCKIITAHCQIRRILRQQKYQPSSTSIHVGFNRDQRFLKKTFFVHTYPFYMSICLPSEMIENAYFLMTSVDVILSSFSKTCVLHSFIFVPHTRTINFCVKKKPPLRTAFLKIAVFRTFSFIYSVRADGRQGFLN